MYSKTQSGWEKKAFLCFIVFCFHVNSLALSQSLYKEALLRKDGRSRQLWADFNASPVSLHLLGRIQCQLFGPLCILQSGFYCASRLSLPQKKKMNIKSQLKWPFRQSFRGMRRHDLGDVRMYQFNFSDLSEMFSNKRGAFFIENFPIQTQPRNVRKTLKLKLKEGKRNEFVQRRHIKWPQVWCSNTLQI